MCCFNVIATEHVIISFSMMLNLNPQHILNQTNRPPFRRFFTPEEDRQLLQLFEETPNNWVAIANRMHNRSPKQCRDRYCHYLSPDLEKKKWTFEEDQRLLELVQKHGNHWNYLTQFLPGRSSNDLKNRFHKHIKTKFSPDTTLLECTPCEVVTSQQSLFDPQPFELFDFNDFLSPSDAFL